MSVYSIKGKGWRYDFILNGTRYTETWFKTKTKAKQAENQRREELKNPKPVNEAPTDMAFLELVNRRLDHIKAYSAERHYQEYLYQARRWIKRWPEILCSQITEDMVQEFVLGRKRVSPNAANKDIRYLRSTFNFGKKKKWIKENPADGIDFFPVEKRIKYVPSSQDIDKVIQVANPDTKDYLWVIRESMARVSEVNRLVWGDINFEDRSLVLYTRKKKGGHLTPRKIPMTNRLYEVLWRRYLVRDKTKPWVFWHAYLSSKTGEKKEGPFKDRKKFMKTLCKKAGVRYFRFHALRHSGASVMDNNNVSLGAIQRILGHENRTTTEIYLHTLGETERKAIEIFEKSREKSHTDSHTENPGVVLH